MVKMNQRIPAQFMFLSPGSPVSIVEVIVETGPDLAETGHGRENGLQRKPDTRDQARLLYPRHHPLV